MFPVGVAPSTLTFLQLHNSNNRVKDEYVDWLSRIIDNQAHGRHLARGLLPVGSMPSLCVHTGELYENSGTMNISSAISSWRLICLFKEQKAQWKGRSNWDVKSEICAGASYPGLRWITALLCFTISLHLNFCKIWCLFFLIFSVWLQVILRGLPSSRSTRWRGGLVVLWFDLNLISLY